MNQRIDPISWLLLLALAGLWSITFPLNEIALLQLDPFTVVFGRVLFGALAIWVFVLATGLPIPKGRGIWIGFLVMGALNNAIPFSLIVWGQKEILGGEAAILNATTPIFSVLLGHFITSDDKLSWNRLAGIFIGIAGVTIMIGVETADIGSRSMWSYLAIIGSSISYAFAAHAGRRVAAGIRGPVAVAGMLTMSTLWMLPVMLLFGDPLPERIAWSTTASVAALGILGASVAYLVYFRILKRAGATNLMLVTMMIPPLSVVLGALFLGEAFGLNDFGGLALILLALAIIDGRAMRVFLRK